MQKIVYLIVVCLVVTCHLMECSFFDMVRMEQKDGNIRILFAENYEDDTPFEIHYNLQSVVSMSATYEDCTLNGNHRCRKYPKETYFVINKLNDHCVTLNYSSDADVTLKAEINLYNLRLYGGAEHMVSEWPVDNTKYLENAYVTKNEFYQAILEPYWLMSNGYYIYVDNAVPLFVSVHPQPLPRIFQLAAQNASPYLKKNLKLGLNFTLCKFENVRVAHEHAVEHFLGKPTALPDVRRVKFPIWSTWVKYKEHINEEVVFNYAKEIAEHGYGGQVEIDDHWEHCYGSLTPDEGKFPDLKNLVDKIKRLNFTVTIWIHPFVNLNCEPTHSVAQSEGYFVRNEEGNISMRWWRGAASYLDFTNPKAREWFRKRLLNLRSNYNIDSFKFDGGESGFSPQLAEYYTMDDEHPETIVKDYVKMIASMGTNVHTRVARGTQRHPIFVTMMDRDSHWGRNLGLPTLITQLLQMNILGYSFVLPDMIGGNFYGIKASAELFVRWLQVNVFMPSLQFSVPPWDYGDEYNKMAKKFIDLHSEYSDRIIKLMQKNVETGAPVNPPLWWIAPNDPEALICDTEFLLGEDLLVAPVLAEGATSRDIYLPEGYWQDNNNLNARLIKGPIWLRDYRADLSVLPYFKKVVVSDSTLTAFNVVHFPNHFLKEDYSFDYFAVFSLAMTFCVSLFVILYMSRRFFRWRRSFS